MHGNKSQTYAAAALCYLSKLGLIRDNPGYLLTPGVANSAWYWLGPNIQWTHLAGYAYGGGFQPPKHVHKAMVSAVATGSEWWVRIVNSYQGNFNHTGG